MKTVISHQPSAISRSQSGFTLIEVLLSAFIFMSVITIAIGSFTSQLTLQSSSEAQRNVQQAAQAIVETIARDFRTYNAEFAVTPPGSCGNKQDLPGTICGTHLTLGSGENHKSYKLVDGEDVVRYCEPGCSGSGSALNDRRKVRVTDFRVEAQEAPDPPNQTGQPFIMIHLSLETVTTGRQEDVAKLEIRTVVSSRLFEKYTN